MRHCNADISIDDRCVGSSRLTFRFSNRIRNKSKRLWRHAVRSNFENSAGTAKHLLLILSHQYSILPFDSSEDAVGKEETDDDGFKTFLNCKFGDDTTNSSTVIQINFFVLFSSIMTATAAAAAASNTFQLKE